MEGESRIAVCKPANTSLIVGNSTAVQMTNHFTNELLLIDAFSSVIHKVLSKTIHIRLRTWHAGEDLKLCGIRSAPFNQLESLGPISS